MRLSTLSRISLVALAVGIAAAVGIGLAGWLNARTVNSELTRIFELRHEVREVTLAIDYVTMLRGGGSALDGAAGRAEALAEDILAIDHPQSRVAGRHLQEIAYIARSIRAEGTSTSLMNPNASERSALLDLMRQLQVHENGLTAAFQRIVSDRYQALSGALLRDLGALLLMGLLIGMPAVAALVLIYFRIRGPLREFQAGIRKLTAGEEDVHIDVRARDELGQMARSFNEMSAKLQRRTRSLHDSEQRFRELAENIEDVFWVYEPASHRVVYVSPAFESIFGVSGDAVYEDADAWQRTIIGRDLDRVRSFANRRARQADEIRYRIRRPDGSIRYIHDRGFPVFDEHGDVARITGVARDVTELVRSEVQLHERVKEQACIYRTQALTAETSRSTEAILAEIAEFIPGYMLHEHTAVARIVVGDAEYRSPAWAKPVDKHTAEIAAEERTEGFIEIGYIREEPRFELGDGPFMAEEIRLIAAVADQIAHMIKSRRTAETLSQSERLNAIGELTGGVAHDFNNLLTVIEGNAEMLVERLEGSEDNAELARMVLDAAERGSRLTGRLLAFARRQPLEPREVDVNRQLADMRPLLERTLGEGIRVDFELADVPHRAMIDPTQLETAVLNLAINARDAMPDGGRLVIETQEVRRRIEHTAGEDGVAPGDYIQVAVSDTGTGIPEGEREHVFEPFYTTKETGRGTGLGLSMVYGFVRQSRGNVELESEPGQGTTVRLLLPRYRGSEEASRRPAEADDLQLEGQGR
ncbi:MAG: ATP-binding protein, partial [Candidatus Wenzhouxiangella sp. M2_3B_020]